MIRTNNDGASQELAIQPFVPPSQEEAITVPTIPTKSSTTQTKTHQSEDEIPNEIDIVPLDTISVKPYAQLCFQKDKSTVMALLVKTLQYAHLPESDSDDEQGRLSDREAPEMKSSSSISSSEAFSHPHWNASFGNSASSSDESSGIYFEQHDSDVLEDDHDNNDMINLFGPNQIVWSNPTWLLDTTTWNSSHSFDDENNHLLADSLSSSGEDSKVWIHRRMFSCPVAKSIPSPLRFRKSQHTVLNEISQPQKQVAYSILSD